MGRRIEAISSNSTLDWLQKPDLSWPSSAGGGTGNGVLLNRVNMWGAGQQVLFPWQQKGPISPPRVLQHYHTFTFLLLGATPCGMQGLGSQPGVEPRPSAVEVWCLSRFGLSGKSSQHSLLQRESGSDPEVCGAGAALSLQLQSCRPGATPAPQVLHFEPGEVPVALLPFSRETQRQK